MADSQSNIAPSSTAAPAPRAETAARCHEIQVALGQKDVPEFESVLEIGMAVRLALHLRGLPLIPFESVRMVATHYLAIPSLAVRRVVELLAEVEFVFLQTEGKTIKAVLPKVPYYESLYDTLGGFASTDRAFSSAEELTLDIVRRLARSPHHLETLRHATGADRKLYDRAVGIGREGNFIVQQRTRGRDVLLSPTYFSENAKTFADLVVTSGATTIQSAMASLRKLQGVPLSLIESGKVAIDDRQLPPAEVRVLSELARHGGVKPPSITTEHAGEQFFLFTPTPSGAALPTTKRDIYERAMNLVAAVRQGQFLAKNFRINRPGAVLYVLHRDGKLGRATTEASAQYQQLVRHRVARLVPAGNSYAELHLIDTEENREALRIALALVDEGAATGVEVDEEARRALQMDHQYLESIVASGKLRSREVVPMTEDEQYELDMVFSGLVVS